MAPWLRHLRWLLVSIFVLVTAAICVVWIGNPYGNLTTSPLRHVLMDDNQRYQYPAVIRSGSYDSLVVGTSTARLLEPKRLEQGFGGRFANLALNSGTAWEQWQVVRLFRRSVAKPATLIVGLDHTWCRADADRERITFRGFPDWLYDDSPWNDLGYMLNTRSVEIAVRRIGHALGLVRERWPHNGYEVFTPPDDRYDAAKAQGLIWGARANRQVEPQTPPYVASESERRSWAFPALAWLDDMAAATPAFQRIVLLVTPVHVASQPPPGSKNAAQEAECKSRIAAIARRHTLPLIDFRIASPITTRDDNYWDPLHYRQPIAARIVDGLARAVHDGKDDPSGNWMILAK